jgi:transposase
MILLPEHVNLSSEQILVDETVTVMLRSQLLTAACPSCGQESLRIHSRYQRKPRDLPVSGRSVRLIIEVRRFFCDKASCPRQTFVEQLPSHLASSCSMYAALATDPATTWPSLGRQSRRSSGP